MRNRRPIFKKLLFSIVMALPCLLAIEIGFRVKAGLDDRQILTAERLREEERGKKKKLELGDIVRISENDRIIYELKPNLSVRFLHADLATNSEGFRDRAYPTEKGRDTVRIVGIGDSVMFGWAVSNGEEYLAVLENLLNERFPEKRWEVLNTAVPGYNTAIEVETLRTKGMKHAPDLVIVGFCGNDIDLPNFVRLKEDPFTLGKSFLTQFVSRRLKHGGRTKKNALGKSPEVRNEEGDFLSFENDPSKVPPRYRYMVGWEGYERAMERLRGLAREGKFDVMVVFYPGAPPEAIEPLRRLRFRIADTFSFFERYREENGIRGIEGSVLSVTRDDPHPSVLAHRLIAEVVLRYMVEKHVIEKLAARAGAPSGRSPRERVEDARGPGTGGRGQ